MLKRVARECRDFRQWQVYVLDGWAYLVRRDWVVRIDWFEFRALERAVRQDVRYRKAVAA